MLQKLYIQNYAIIDEIEIEFSRNLNIITGETGAGKSILMGALNLILGERADTAVLLNKEKKCSVEGVFNAKKNSAVQDFLQENDLDTDEQLTIRREIGATGKSRAFINDTPVNLSQLKKLTSSLVDLHQQFDTLELGEADFQRKVIDAIADNQPFLQQYQQVYAAYVTLKKELDLLKAKQQEINKELDYNQFLWNELEEAGLQENELEELEEELKILNNAENIKQELNGICFELQESEHPIVQQLKILGNRLSSLSEFNKNMDELAQRLHSAQVELEDIARELESQNDHVKYHPDRLQIINDKLSIGYKLFKKHNVSTTNELLSIKEVLQQKLDNISNIGNDIVEKEKQLAALHADCKRQAAVLSENRKKAVEPFTQKVNKLLAQVGMPNARLAIEVNTFDVIQANGCDAIEFLFDANKSGRLELLHKVASGGELSRLMLCIKSLVTKKLQLPTLIFDEIDTGISGEAARQVGIIMKDLATAHQVIAITHQPQIAARANAHYFVYKSGNQDKITTSIRLLNIDERVNAIAQMLSGEKPSAAALQNAREMLEV